MLTRRSDDLLELTPGVGLGGRPALEADEDLVSQGKRLALHHEGHVHLLPVRLEHDEVLLLVLEEGADEGLAGAGDDIHDLSDGPLLAGAGVELEAGCLHLHDVIRERTGEILRRNVQVLLVSADAEEALARPRDRDRSFVRFFRLRHFLQTVADTAVYAMNGSPSPQVAQLEAAVGHTSWSPPFYAALRNWNAVGRSMRAISSKVACSAS